MVSGRLIITLALVAAAPALAAASLDAAIGKRLFERNWVAAPSSTVSDDGLGPLYDARSCASCHVAPTASRDDETIAVGTIIRLGNASGDADPVYGRQLQTRALPQQTVEAFPDISFKPQGALRVVTLDLRRFGYGPLAPSTQIALRRAPLLAGVGLLAEVPESEIVGRADPEDSNGDGMRGRAAWLTINGARVLGRFGWKATQPDLAAQTAMALSRDLGLSTTNVPDAWGDCTAAQKDCYAGPHGADQNGIEVVDSLRDLIVAHLKSLPPPSSTTHARGAAIFAQTGCQACHATLRLPNGTPLPAYTDLLLHDMGAGLNDGIKEGVAAPGQWRTAPLWGTGSKLQTGGLLHDERARNVTEAIEWHGGEAAGARTRFDALAEADKAALLAFVSGL